jgi:hypothetical protein
MSDSIAVNRIETAFMITLVSSLRSSPNCNEIDAIFKTEGVLLFDDETYHSDSIPVTFQSTCGILRALIGRVRMKLPGDEHNFVIGAEFWSR